MSGLAALALGVAVAATSAGGALPRSVVAALDHHFPGWRFARLDSRVQAQLATGDTPRWVAGDFDGDGRRDHAIQIVRRGTPHGEAQAVVAVLGRDGTPRVIRAMAESGATYLRLARRGERLRDLDHDVMGGRRVVLEHDAIHVLSGQEAGVTCRWTAATFRCFTSGD